ncbi:hypothetical protein TVD_04530 [Thioalkalivibrio versutus]|uniref:Dicarboxylate transport domain-containing protein n=1 Tax=Thioalkalivibrio versutus TaxID=106634 RepID=A0A0G3G5E1_9GAMM|nr:hypothetical protein [Thioalkalivibrio versutus]AKJ94682.1 hypothetical protein TVD_04530 [Thioalkalivibrio versutus]
MLALRRAPGLYGAAAGLVLFLLAGVAVAADAEAEFDGGIQLDLRIESLLRDDLDAHGLRTRVQWTREGLSLAIRADRVELPEPIGALQDLRVECSDLQVSRAEVRCDTARLWGDAGDLHLRGAPVGLYWGRETGALALAGAWPGWFGAQGDFQVRLDPARGWDVRADFAGINLAALAGSARLPMDLPVHLGQGTADLALHWRERGRSEVTLTVHDLAFSDDLGLQAGEELDGWLRLAGDADGWDVDLALTAGVVFVDPWFVDLDAEGPLTLDARGVVVDGESRAVRAGSLSLDYGEAASLQGQGLAFAPERGLDGQFRGEVGALGVIYETVLSPWLVGTALGELDAAGRMTGEVEVQASEPHYARLEWSGVEAQDRRGRFGVSGAQGELDWSATVPGGPGRIGFDAAHLYGLPFDGFSARVRARPQGLELLEATEIPILDGGLRVRAFSVQQTETGPDVQFQGGIRAISLESLTGVLGWPRFSGQVAGMIPRVRLEDGDLNVDGRLLVQVFDGEVVLRDVYIHDLFGYAPELGLSTQIQRLDLELVTRAFDIGRIQGRLSGHVNDLVMVDWSPVHMDLELMTPMDDPGRRRISQRAVENITELGGGLQAAASSIFLRVFENFSYRRLGFRCELRGDVCTASGVADRPDGGFVLVQGGGLPQIEVIGYNRRVDWPELIDRLATIQGGEGPVVQ